MANETNRQRPEEQEAVRTTIVGGRPPGCGTGVGGVPRGIEVLVKKAAVDADFRSLLLSKRGEAAKSIGLELSAAESMMLSAVPVAQLRSVIEATTVPPSHVPALLGKVAAVMLAALGIIQSGCDQDPLSLGIRPKTEPAPKDNAAAASRPTEPADVAQFTIAGVVRITPLTQPATQSTTPIPPLTSALDTPLVVAGLMYQKPPALSSVQSDDPTLRSAGVRADNPTATAGERIDRPTASSNPATLPVEVAGARATRPEDVTVLGARAKRPTTESATKPASQPATKPQTQPATTQPLQKTGIAGIMIDRPADQPPPVTVLGITIDRPQNTAVRGIRADIPKTTPATQPTTQPATGPASSPPVTMFGAIADRPETVKGTRVDRPATPLTTPATNPTTKPATTQSAPPRPPFPVAGVPAEPLSRGVRPDRPPVPRLAPKPAAQSEPPPKPDFPIAIDGIRPDRPEERK